MHHVEDPTGAATRPSQGIAWPRAPALAGARVVVTGAAGFIGSQVTRALLASGVDRLVALDLRPFPDNGASLTNSAGGSSTVVLVQRDILEPLDDLIAGSDVVFHLAAHVSPPGSVRDPAYDAQHNILGTVAVLESCRRVGVPRLVYSSSCAVYGDPLYQPIDEAHPTHPQSPYGLSKLSGERYCLLYAELYRLSCVALRYFNVYGPNQPTDRGYAAVIPRFRQWVTAGVPLQIEGDGDQTRDFVHLADVVRANLLAATAGYVGILNVGSGRAISILDLARAIGGPDYPIAWAPPRVGDIRESVAAVAAAEGALGFTAAVSLEAGLADLCRS
jgi:UDP-glucose 4-epimerase